MELMNAEEAANYLQISVKNLYQIANQGGIPATRIGNKWIFSKDIIDNWIYQSAQENVSPHMPVDKNTIISAGSNDFIWEILSHKMIQSPHSVFLPHASIGSMEGLKALKNRQAHSASIHLFDPESGDYNIPFLPRFLKGEKVAVIHLFNRRQGFIVKNGNPKNISYFQDLIRDDITFVNRQEGSGTRILLDTFLTDLKISPDLIKGYQTSVNTHREVALAVLNENVDVGIGVASAASINGLSFVEFQEESYDIVFLKEHVDSPQVQILLDFIKSNSFLAALKTVGGYNLSDAGTILWEGQVA